MSWSISERVETPNHQPRNSRKAKHHRRSGNTTRRGSVRRRISSLVLLFVLLFSGLLACRTVRSVLASQVTPPSPFSTAAVQQLIRFAGLNGVSVSEPIDPFSDTVSDDLVGDSDHQATGSAPRSESSLLPVSSTSSASASATSASASLRHSPPSSSRSSSSPPTGSQSQWNRVRQHRLSPAQRESAAEAVQRMFTRSYAAYMRHAFPLDELRPLSCSGATTFGAYSLTALDALDALLVFGERDEFCTRARWAAAHLRFDADRNVSVFETNIRVLGGLLSAHLLLLDQPHSALVSRPNHARSSLSAFSSPMTPTESHPTEESADEALTRAAELVDPDQTEESVRPERAMQAADRPEPDESSFSPPSASPLREPSDYAGGIAREALTGHLRPPHNRRLSAAAADVDTLPSRAAGAAMPASGPCCWPDYDDELLHLAVDLADRLLRAFETPTGIPYGTVNLRHGVPPQETPITCVAGAGTFSLEFGLLTRLTGNLTYDLAARRAVRAIHQRHSERLGLLGNHINSTDGAWTLADASIGTAVDSFYEYLVKASILFGDHEYQRIWEEAYPPILQWVRRHFWYISVNQETGSPANAIQNSLATFWPGIQAQIGDLELASRSMKTLFQMWRQYGSVPEGYAIADRTVKSGQDGYPLRPEMAESLYKLYRATGDPVWQRLALEMVYSIERVMRAPCGYAALRNVQSHRKTNLMDSFFLSETAKYLYLIFDEENWVNQRPYVFNTEAHLFPVRFAFQSTAWESPPLPSTAAASSPAPSSSPSTFAGLWSNHLEIEPEPEPETEPEPELEPDRMMERLEAHCGYCGSHKLCVRLCVAASRVPVTRTGSSATPLERPRAVPPAAGVDAPVPQQTVPSTIHTFMANTIREKLRSVPAGPSRGSFYDESVAPCAAPNWFQDTLVVDRFDPIFPFYESVLGHPPLPDRVLSPLERSSSAHSDVSTKRGLLHKHPLGSSVEDVPGHHRHGGVKAGAEDETVGEGDTDEVAYHALLLQSLMSPPLSPLQSDLFRRLRGAVASPIAPLRTYKSIFYYGNGSLALRPDQLCSIFEHLCRNGLQSE